MAAQAPSGSPFPLGRRAVVHIGLTKTGTTTIQGWLGTNREALRRQGIHFDQMIDRRGHDLGMPQGYAFLGLVQRPGWLPNERHRALFRIRDRADLLARLAAFERRAEATFPPPEGGTLAISTEDIGTRLRGPRSVRALDGWLRARFARVDYVAYLRDQVEWVPSGYSQHVLMGGTDDLEAFIDRAGLQDYHALGRTWAEAVGEDRLHLRLLDPAGLRGGDLLADFAALIGADLARTERGPRRNEGMAAARVTALLRVNRLAESLGQAGLPDLRGALAPLTRPWGRGPKLRLTAEQAARVAALNAPGNEALRAWRFPERATLFPGRGPAGAPASPSPAPRLGAPHASRA